MPQTFQVFKCYKCCVFQVHQTKKSNKFECKLCGEKQSIKRHYGLGNGKECRLHVQKLNGIRGEIDNIKSSSKESTDEEIENEIEDCKTNLYDIPNEQSSKWLEYVEPDKEHNDPVSDEPMYMGTMEVVTEIPRKRKVAKNNFLNLNLKTDEHLNVNDENSDATYNKRRFVDVKNTATHVSSNYYSYTNQSKVSIEHSIDKTFDPLTVESNTERENKKPLKVPLTNMSSKWMQFVEDNESDSESSQQHLPLSVIKSPTLESRGIGLFSSCDDSELDSILDI